MALRRLTGASEPETLAALFVRNRDVHARVTRTSCQFRPPRIRTEFGRKRFAYRAAALFNALPADVRDQQGNRRAFGKALKQHMLSAG